MLGLRERMCYKTCALIKRLLFVKYLLRLYIQMQVKCSLRLELLGGKVVAYSLCFSSQVKVSLFFFLFPISLAFAIQ